MKTSFEANPIETKVINYIIKELVSGRNARDLDYSFLDNISVRGTRHLWVTIVGSIKNQLALNPEDKDGFSVVPRWVRNVYVRYRNSVYHDCWVPGELNLETVPNRQEVEQETRLAYATVEDLAIGKISLIPYTDKPPEFYSGYLKGVGAKKFYKVTLEELGYEPSM